MATTRRARMISMAGSILSSGFASGDRVVVGHWSSTPLGPITDVMWASPDDVRTLYVPSVLAGEFIAGVYDFDAVVVAEFTVDEHRPERGGPRLDVTIAPSGNTEETGTRSLHFAARRGIPISFPRPAAFTRHVEGPIARALMGVHTYGVSPTGVEEWYRADRWRPMRAASGRVDGRSLGAMAPIDPPGGFGFSEPPKRPSWVDVRPLLAYPSRHPHA